MSIKIRCATDGTEIIYETLVPDPDTLVQSSLTRERIDSFAGAIERHREGIITRTSHETGIPVKHVRDEYEQAISAVRRLDTKVFSTEMDGVRYVAKGKVLLILPWNSSVLGSVLLSIIAAAAGNAVVVRPSTKTLAAAQSVREAVKETGLDSQIEFLFCEAGAIADLVHRFDLVFFMGSRRHGLSLAAICAGLGVEFIGEYEGNDWAIVDDGDISSMAEEIVSNFTFKNGQDCDAFKGLLVRQEHHEQLLAAIRSSMSKLRVGNPLSHDTDVGPLISRSSQEAVSQTLKAAGVEESFTGLPLLIDDELCAKALLRTPLFAPVVWVLPFSTIEEAVALTHQNPYGLCYSVYSSDEGRARRIAEALLASRIVINGSTLAFDALGPWGGRGLTGHGGARSWTHKFTNQVLIEPPHQAKTEEP